MFENLDDPIDVLSVFTTAGVEPVRFRWRSTVFQVVKLTGHWQHREGASLLHHFAVECAGGESFELRFDPRLPGWSLTRSWRRLGEAR